MKDDHTKNSTFRKCEKTKNEHIEHSQQIESEQKVALICEICSKTLDNLYNLNLHKEKCKEKRIFICKICSKQLDNLHNLNEHERKCKKKYNETKITYKCSICSKVLDNKSNLLQHETKCKKKHHKAVKDRKKKKKDHHRSTLITQLESKYDTILKEENIITEKLKQTKSKITDRQHQILKLDKQISAYEKKNNSDGNYLRKQITDLQDQICKYKSLIQDLSDKKMELNSQKTAITHNLQLLHKELSTDESDIPVTRKLPNTHITRNQQTAQNPRKSIASDPVGQTNESSQCDTDLNVEIPAKKTRNSNYKTQNFGSNTQEKLKKVQKREYMKQKCMSTEYREKENLKQREGDAPRHSLESDTAVNVDIPSKKPRYSNSTEESDIPVTRQLPNINLTRNNQTTQNPRKRRASDSIRQTNESSQSDTDVNVEIPAKKL